MSDAGLTVWRRWRGLNGLCSAALVLSLTFGTIGAVRADGESEASAATSDETASTDESQMPAVGRVTGLPIPRFVSLRKSRANARVGPGPNYPVQWVYLRQGLPVEITAELNNWRRIRDRDGDEAWVYHALVDGRRMALVQNEQITMWRKEGDGKNEVLAYLDPGVIVRLLRCSETQCRIEVNEIKGWVDRSALWGLYPDERLD